MKRLENKNYKSGVNMSKVIAMAGKGGVGKTTVSALLIRYFTKQEKGPLLAIDADFFISAWAAYSVYRTVLAARAEPQIKDTL